MVTTTRISKERYATAASRTAVRQNAEREPARSAREEENEYAQTRIDYPEDERFTEFSREMPAPEYDYDYDRRAAAYETDRAEPRARRYAEEDLMPTIRTMRQLNRMPVQNEETEREQKRANRREPAKAGKLSPTAKMMIAVYALIVAIAVILIISTSVAAARSADDAAALQARGAALETTIAGQEKEISGLLDLDANDPQLSGYESAGAGKTFQLKELKDETVYEARTNWFDWLCRLFSN
ncbi:hypothetical protein FACS1894211_13940 [Clostridia bacterium]|nr:hypothetical protein FACS1894211_13940 [Clostridia bacterium]